MEGHADQENVIVTSNRRSSSSSVGLQKSLIPKPVSSSTSPRNENTPPVLTPKTGTGLKVRKPLGSIQNAESPRPRPGGKETPKKTESEIKAKGIKSVTRGSLTENNSNRVRGGGIPNTPQNSPRKSKLKKPLTNADDSTAESIGYWKELAESRRKALEEALQENYELHQRVEELKNDNAQLEDLVKEATNLAMMINEASLEEIDLDESGIGDADVSKISNPTV